MLSYNVSIDKLNHRWMLSTDIDKRVWLSSKVGEEAQLHTHTVILDQCEVLVLDCAAHLARHVETSKTLLTPKDLKLLYASFDTKILTLSDFIKESLNTTHCQNAIASISLTYIHLNTWVFLAQ